LVPGHLDLTGGKKAMNSLARVIDAQIEFVRD